MMVKTIYVMKKQELKGKILAPRTLLAEHIASNLGAKY